MEGKVRIRFIRCGGFISWAIAHVTGSLFSHVEFGTPAGTWIGAHIGDGIQERPANYCTPKLEFVYEIPCTIYQERLLLASARGKIGTKYNTLDILGLLFQIRSLRSSKRDICSQFCTGELLRVFGAAKVLNVLESWDYRITPETLHLSPIFVGHRVKKT
jgi:hypothetical protein